MSTTTIVGVVDVLNAARVSVSSEAEGEVHDKSSALARLATLLATSGAAPRESILRVLSEREAVQSTGVGGGVAVPHGAVDELDQQVGALLVCPQPIPFDAIDGKPVSILFALVGPKGAPAQHLKILARMSRLLRNESFRAELARAQRGSDAFELVVRAEQEGP